jgi:hypothetical protein
MNRIHDRGESFLPPDFQAEAAASAQLVWTDDESGETLSIELLASREFLKDLEAEGFLLRPAHATFSPARRCRIQAESSQHEAG